MTPIEPEKTPKTPKNQIRKKPSETFVEVINLGGFKYLAEKNRTVRIIWASVIVVFLALTVYQISTQVTRYVSNPISTNVEVEYPQKINFPAIVLCNNNQFRQSYLLQREFRRLVHQNRTIESNRLYFEQLIDAIKDRPAMVFLRNSTSNMLTQVASCILPNGTECHRAMWSEYWTVNGICWALNLDMDNPFEIKEAGPSHGLKLVLNVESYERTDTCGRVLNSQAETGFKILIFNQTDRPITNAEGVSVAPGMSVNIPFRIKRRSKLPGPHCRVESDQSRAAVKNLMSADNIKACHGRIFHEKFEEKCNCSIRGLFTSEMEIDNECDIQMYFGCVLPYQRSLHASLTTEIGQQCLPACETMEYIPMQDVSGLPKNLFPPINDTRSLLSKKEMKVEGVEKRFVGLDENGTRKFEEITLNCVESTYISKAVANRTRYRSRFVLEQRSRADLVERETFSNLVDDYENQEKFLAELGWSWMENDTTAYSIVEKILNRTQACKEVLWIFKNERDTFADSPAVELLVRRKAADVVKRIPLREFRLDEYVQAVFSGKLYKHQLAELIQVHAYVSFFHGEFQRYWSHPIQDFHYEAEAAFIRERDSMAKVLKAKFGDDNETNLFYISPNEVDSCLQKIQASIADEGADFRAQAKKLALAFDAAYKDHIGDYYKKYQIDADFEKQNMAVVNIYLQSNTIESWTQKEDYTFWALACDIGGALGLFLGASVVTILEVVYVLYQYQTRHKQNQEHKLSPPDKDHLEELKAGV